MLVQLVLIWYWCYSEQLELELQIAGAGTGYQLCSCELLVLSELESEEDKRWTLCYGLILTNRLKKHCSHRMGHACPKCVVRGVRGMHGAWFK